MLTIVLHLLHRNRHKIIIESENHTNNNINLLPKRNVNMALTII